MLKETLQLNKVFKNAEMHHKFCGNASIKEEPPLLNKVFKNTEKIPQHFCGNASKKRNHLN